MRRRRRRGVGHLLGAAVACTALQPAEMTAAVDAFLIPSSGVSFGGCQTPARTTSASNTIHVSSPAEFSAGPRISNGIGAGGHEKFLRTSLWLRATTRGVDNDLKDGGVVAHPPAAQSHEREERVNVNGAHVIHKATHSEKQSALSREALSPSEAGAGTNNDSQGAADAISAPKAVATATAQSDDRTRKLAQLERLKAELRQKQTNVGTNRDRSSASLNNEHVRSTAATAGLSKCHRSLLGPTLSRQRFVTGRYPLRITVKDDPTRKFLGQTATSQLLVNGTSVDRSLASFERYQWLDDDEKAGGASDFSLELIAEIHIKKPGYLNVLPGDGAGASAKVRRQFRENYGGWKNRWKFGTGPSMQSEAGEAPYGDRFWQSEKGGENDAAAERLWITGFSLTKQSGELGYVEVESGKMGAVNKRTAKAIRWPNEVSPVPASTDGHLPVGVLDPRMQEGGADAAINDGSLEENENKSGNGPLAIINKGSGPLATADDDDRMFDSDKEPDDDALLVSDGFLVPGRDRGGLYVVRNPGDDSKEWRVCLTDEDDEGWFYHRAVWVDLTGDGRQSILTARARIPSVLKGDGTGGGKGGGQTANAEGQLVWLERPRPPKHDPLTGTPLEDVGGTVFDPYSALNTPWTARVLDTGPDVMFAVADLDPNDGTIEVIASNFFDRSVTLHSIRIGAEPRVVFRRTIDGRCGAAFSSVLADLDGPSSGDGSSGGRPRVLDSGSTVPTLRRGDTFSHVLVTSHECTFAEKNQQAQSRRGIREEALAEEDFDIRIVNSDTTGASSSKSSASLSSPSAPASPASESRVNEGGGGADKIDGGSLFAYRVPTGPRGNEWRTEPWLRTVMATGFRVRGQLGNMINPGAPGFCYTFYPTKDGGARGGGSGSRGAARWTRPLIGIAGDCAEAAYILRPSTCSDDGDDLARESGTAKNDDDDDRSARYSLVCKIETGATVGSLGIGYDDFCGSTAEQQSGYAKIYVPCYERDRVLVFAMGTGEEELVLDEKVEESKLG